MTIRTRTPSVLSLFSRSRPLSLVDDSQHEQPLVVEHETPTTESENAPSNENKIADSREGRKQISYRMPRYLFERAETLVKQGRFSSMSDIITISVTRFIDEETGPRPVYLEREIRKIVHKELARMRLQLEKEAGISDDDLG